MNKFLLVQTALGDYRQNVLSCICDELGDDFHVLSGREYFESSTLTRVDIGSRLSMVDNLFFWGRRFLIQKGVVAKSVSARSLILEMNPRIGTVWLILLLRKLVRKKTTLWGHAWPRDGRHAKSDTLRNILRSLGDHILVYTDTQKSELRERMPNKSISSAPNALYKAKDMWVQNSSRKNFVYVGRLIDTKKPKLMIKAYSEALTKASLGDLIIVGDGPERSGCEALVCELGLSENVKFLGHVSDLNILRHLYSESVASLSPGYVGLSITQSFSFGTPMIAADNEPHAPEIEAAIKNVNCIFFSAGDVSDMSRAMLSAWTDRSSWKGKEGEIIADCKARYSAELMASRIIEAFQLCQK